MQANALNSTQSGASNRPAHPSDGWLLADIAVQRLGGPHGPNAPAITGVSVAGGYGLVVYQIGPSVQELLCLKEGDHWRPLGADAYTADGRGLVRFGLSPTQANRLISGLRPPPTQ